VLEGGYKRWRELVRVQLYDTPFPAPVVLLGGGTGTGKTDILLHARALGVQVIDLEGLAQHRGSVFGKTGAQPSQKLFETRLAQAVAALDPERPVLIEAESNRIGAIRLPPSLWDAMRAADLVEVTAPLDARAAYIAQRYADMAQNPDLIARSLAGLRKHHSTALVQAWHGMAADPADLARSLIERHYDPRYARVSQVASVRANITLQDLSRSELKLAAQRLCDLLSDDLPKS